VYTRGLEKHPKSYRLLRHRGHRYITLRKFDAAIEDLKLAAGLIPPSPTLMEPDGVPNKINRPISSTQFNVWYHLGAAYYFKGDFINAETAFKQCLNLSINDDLLVSATDWLYMTMHNLDKAEGAKLLLDQIGDNVVLIENDSYFKRIKMYKGQIPPEKLLELKPINAKNSIGLATQGYGVGHHFLMKGNKVRAIQVFQKVLETAAGRLLGTLPLRLNLLEWEKSQK
jgi:tetratricopeptide (TPR) repeat protein